MAGSLVYQARQLSCFDHQDTAYRMGLSGGDGIVERQFQQWVIDILQAHPGVTAVAFGQRAKFEGWLKFELAETLLRHGASSLEVEPTYSSGRADLAFRSGGEIYYVELKTPNTNWHMDGVQSKTRPITKNIRSIVDDARKLRSCDGRGLLVFVMFPVPPRDNRWKKYLKRIATDSSLALDLESNCTQASMKLSDRTISDVIVACVDVTPSFTSRTVSEGQEP